ncbi:Putative hydroxypyruvate isomerase YgbM [Pigmentiphaga humi]|uniref:Hydroxypyruvate isomerase YgbM n=1 Tax=Pigmentiphaga humi TaxID=2478468 RepID=A0A3P4AZC0_9BURK|nr:2-oxo-tetronate isomerase [Pigmentiphaga humi]VCU69419.1 Putative hydroxypyruvate isomerase YgbM [Pigmentiphaga humi]
MPRFAANLSMLYPEHAFLDRFACAERDGFEAVEFFFPYAYPAEELAARLRAHGLELVFFNATPRSHPDERGIACLPERRDEFRASFLRALDIAETLDCARLHVMPGRVPAGADLRTLHAVYAENLAWAAERAQASGRSVLIEPINVRDVPGFFLTRQAQAHALIEEIGSPCVQVQMDLYHCQIVEGDLAARLRRYLPTGRVGHLQIAGVPDRHEPDEGEVHFPYLFELIDALGYDGWVGCEYHPRQGDAPGGTSAGLEWLRRAGGLTPRAARPVR